MKIEEMEVSELKIMAYDVMVSIQKLQNDLVGVNSVIAQKQNPPKIVKPEKNEGK